MGTFKYKQMIDRPTRVTRKSETLIDLIFSNRPESVIKTYNLITGLTYLVNLSILTNRFPESWKKAIITPVYKSGERDLAGNYRPIAILPVV